MAVHEHHTLNNDIVSIILPFVNPYDLKTVPLVCTEWSDAFNNEITWKEIYISSFNLPSDYTPTSHTIDDVVQEKKDEEIVPTWKELYIQRFKHFRKFETVVSTMEARAKAHRTLFSERKDKCESVLKYYNLNAPNCQNVTKNYDKTLLLFNAVAEYCRQNENDAADIVPILNSYAALDQRFYVIDQEERYEYMSFTVIWYTHSGPMKLFTYQDVDYVGFDCNRNPLLKRDSNSRCASIPDIISLRNAILGPHTTMSTYSFLEFLTKIFVQSICPDGDANTEFLELMHEWCEENPIVYTDQTFENQISYDYLTMNATNTAFLGTGAVHIKQPISATHTSVTLDIDYSNGSINSTFAIGVVTHPFSGESGGFIWRSHSQQIMYTDPRSDEIRDVVLTTVNLLHAQQQRLTINVDLERSTISFCGNEIQVKLEDGEWYFVLFAHENIRCQIVKQEIQYPTQQIFSIYQVLENYGEHVGVRCDRCNAMPLTGVRYKCKNCYNFDFCEACFQLMPEEPFSHHLYHSFLQLESPFMKAIKSMAGKISEDSLVVSMPASKSHNNFAPLNEFDMSQSQVLQSSYELINFDEFPSDGFTFNPFSFTQDTSNEFTLAVEQVSQKNKAESLEGIIFNTLDTFTFDAPTPDTFKINPFTSTELSHEKTESIEK
jgi:hypothetical protein